MCNTSLSCGIKKCRQAKNGGAERGGWFERESQEESGQDRLKCLVGWTCGTNGRKIRGMETM